MTETQVLERKLKIILGCFSMTKGICQKHERLLADLLPYVEEHYCTIKMEGASSCEPCELTARIKRALALDKR